MKECATGFNPTYSNDAPTKEHVSEMLGYAFLEFGAPWCGHCVAAFPAIEEGLSNQQLPHIKVYDGKGLPLGRSFKVKLWPTLILLHDGKEVARVIRPTQVSEVNELLANVES